MKDDPVSGCNGKQRFESRGIAVKVMKRRNKRGRDGGVYRCPNCRGYHIGHARTDVNKGRKSYDD